MAEKCPKAKFISRAVLEGYRQTALNVVPDENSSVDGVLWEVDEQCVEALDQYENCPNWYKRKEMTVFSEKTGNVSAIVYYRP